VLFKITEIILPKKALKRDNRYQRDKKRKQCRRLAAIEPIIGHLKSDFRLSRNFLKGEVGDEINVLMAAAAWNLKKWLNHFFVPVFYWRFTQIRDVFTLSGRYATGRRTQTCGISSLGIYKSLQCWMLNFFKG